MEVIKFGGTSVGTSDSIRKVAKIVASKIAKQKLLVVVSAIGGVTNKLDEIGKLAAAGDSSYEGVLAEIERMHLAVIRQLLPARQQGDLIGQVKWLQNELEDVCKGIFLLRELTLKSRDYVLSFGERVSSLIVHSYFSMEFEDVAIFNPMEWIVCDDNFGGGHVQFDISKQRALNDRKKLKRINIVPGFIGSSSKGELITLGRGGSDYSASLFANFFEAKKLEIWTDVDGLMTADPKWVPTARSIEHLSYEEALELSHFGAKVIYPPTIQPALEQNIEINIRNTFNEDHPGTVITRTWEDTSAIRGISSISDTVLLNLTGSGMVGIPSFSARLFGALADESVNIIMITQASSEHSICVGVAVADLSLAIEAINDEFQYELKTHLVNKVEVEENLAMLALVGTNMRNQVGVSGQMFNALGQNGVSIKAIAQGSSERNITIVINQFDLKKALNVLHESFFTTEIRKINLFVLGAGNVGQAFLEQIRNQQQFLIDHYHLDVQVVALANSKKMICDQEGIKLDAWTSLLHEGQPYQLNDMLQLISEYNLRNSIFVDVTASETVAEVYAEVLKKSVSVVTPNKIGATSPYQHYQTLKHLARKFKSKFLFETNVCAGLPVISTLNDLIKSGDRIRKIEGVFSGTLNFIFNMYDTSMKFGDVVRMAKNDGYTEPDPRLDLSGKDVMRKILILARESGYAIDFGDVACTRFVPKTCMEAESTEAFFTALDAHESHFAGLFNDAKTENKKLRYVASFDGEHAKAGLEMVDESHPFYHLAGKDNIVLFYTERYKEQPLVIKGAGAGAEVTASGIFADVMKVANTNG